MNSGRKLWPNSSGLPKRAQLYHPRANATKAGSTLTAARCFHQPCRTAPHTGRRNSTTASRAEKGRQPTASASRKKAGSSRPASQKKQPQTQKASASSWASIHTPPLVLSQKVLLPRLTNSEKKAQVSGVFPLCQKSRYTPAATASPYNAAIRLE